MLINNCSPKDIANEALQQLYKAGLPADYDDMGFAIDRAYDALGVALDPDQLNKEAGADYDFFKASVEAFNDLVAETKKTP